MKKNKAFSLIEFLVTMSIFTVISMALFINYPQFKGRVALKRTVQEVALSIRQAQVYGLAVREFGAGSGVFPGYGVNFDINGGETNSFVLFADVDADKLYDAGEDVEQYGIQTGDTIYELCANSCLTPINSLNIVFLRPNPIVTLTEDGFTTFPDVQIKIHSRGGEERIITVWATGQVAVK